MAFNQATRSLQIHTPLPENELVMTGFRGQESMSQLFQFELDLLSENNAIPAAELIGKKVTFSVQRADNSPRFFHGFVSRFIAGDEDNKGRRSYQALVVPWLWFLTLKVDCRIFHGKTVPEIVEQVFQDLDFRDFETSQITGNHPRREYCVQYNETDFDFISRLLEEDGIFYYFRHEEGKHTLVLGDHQGAYVNCQEYEVDYPRDSGTAPVEDHITEWQHRYEFRSGKWAQTDYNFQTPSSDLMTTENSLVQVPGMDKYEVYEYPGLYGNKTDGRALSRVRMEELEVEHDVVDATSQCKTFTPGGKFKLRDHRSPGEADDYVITTIHHEADEPMAYQTAAIPSGILPPGPLPIPPIPIPPIPFPSNPLPPIPFPTGPIRWGPIRIGIGKGGLKIGLVYRNGFLTIKASVVFRPRRITIKPKIQGAQTGIVIGAEGEEIDIDECGRALVCFPWDRQGSGSMRIRVAQFWAGKGWGAHYWPRIGHEVVVEFLDGDPDRPLIIGSVYNAENTPPYELPANQTMSGIKSRSSKDGVESDHNEILFEDKKGEELVRVHAQKDYLRTVENDEIVWVGNDRAKTIDRDENLYVKRHQELEVTENRTVLVKGAFTETINGGETRKVTDGITETIISGGETREITDFQSETIHGDVDQTIHGAMVQTIDNTLLQVIAKGGTVIAPPNYSIVSDNFQVINSDWFDIGKQQISVYGVSVAITGVENIAAALKIEVLGVESFWAHMATSWVHNSIGFYGNKLEGALIDITDAVIKVIK